MSGIIVVGNGGHARACLDAFPAADFSRVIGCTGFDAESRIQVPYLGTDDEILRGFDGDLPLVFVALGDNALRARVTAAVLEQGFSLYTLIAPSASVAPTAIIEPGAAIMRGAIVGAYAAVGAGAIINTAASIDHDCTVGSFAHVAPGSRLAGTVTVGERALIGVGASLIPGISVGADGIVGAGAAVVRDVPPGATAVGVPARVISGGSSIDSNMQVRTFC